MFKKILIGLGALFLLFIIIGVASGGGDDTSTDEPPTAASDPGGDQATTEDAADNEVPEEQISPEAEKKKGPMTFGNWEVQGKLRPKADSLGDFTVNAFRIKNTSDAADSGFFTISILKGQNVLATIDCSTSEVGPGQSGTAECFSTDKFKRGWTEVVIENAF